MTEFQTKERPDYEVANDELAALMASLGLSFSFEFIPLSKVSAERRASWSHDGKPRPFLTWRCALLKGLRRDPVLGVDPAKVRVFETEYSAGSGHCPASKLSVKIAGGHNSIMRDGAIQYECEHGRAALPTDNASAALGYTVRETKGGKPILPDPVDVFASLLSDSGAIDSATYEEWASDCGYDADSRKGEAIYRACLGIALKLRASLGDETLSRAREIAGRL